MAHDTLIVEERLRILEQYMDWLEATARLASETDDGTKWPRGEFVDWAVRVANESRAQLKAIKAGLSVSCTNRSAPAVPGDAGTRCVESRACHATRT